MDDAPPYSRHFRAFALAKPPLKCESCHSLSALRQASVVGWKTSLIDQPFRFSFGLQSAVVHRPFMHLMKVQPVKFLVQEIAESSSILQMSGRQRLLKLFGNSAFPRCPPNGTMATRCITRELLAAECFRDFFVRCPSIPPALPRRYFAQHPASSPRFPHPQYSIVYCTQWLGHQTYVSELVSRGKTDLCILFEAPTNICYLQPPPR